MTLLEQGEFKIEVQVECSLLGVERKLSSLWGRVQRVINDGVVKKRERVGPKGPQVSGKNRRSSSLRGQNLVSEKKKLSLLRQIIFKKRY